MPAEITVRKNGIAEAAFALLPAWHGLGAVLDHPMTSAEAMTAAHLDWEVIQYPTGVILPTVIETPEGPVTGERCQKLPDLLANVRADNMEVLGTVGPNYQVVQNRDAFEFMDSLLEAKEITYESAFSLYGGRQVVVVGRLPGEDQIAGEDTVLPYVMLSLRHDGGGAIKFGPTSVRPVCSNTYAAAIGEGHCRDLAISHMGNIKEKLTKAREILGIARDKLSAYAQVGKALAQRRMTEEEWDAYLNVMAPMPSVLDPDWTEQRAKRIHETRAALTSAWNNSRQMLTGIEHSAWSAFQAVAEHIDHLPRRGANWRARAEARFNIALYGLGRDMKERAFQAACRVAGVNLTAGA